MKPNSATATRTSNTSSAQSHEKHTHVSQPQSRITHVVNQLQPITSITQQHTLTSNNANHVMLLPSATSSSAPALSCVAASVPALPTELIIRRLAADDYSKGHVELLSELTDAGPMTKSEWTERYNSIAALSSVYHIYVIEDTSTQRLVGSATLFVEMKFIHRISHIAHIEDVVVSKETRGKNCGIRLVGYLTDLARSLGCYKVILDCDEANVAFYNKLGYKENAKHLAYYFLSPKDVNIKRGEGAHAS